MSERLTRALAAVETEGADVPQLTARIIYLWHCLADLDQTAALDLARQLPDTGIGPQSIH